MRSAAAQGKWRALIGGLIAAVPTVTTRMIGWLSIEAEAPTGAAPPSTSPRWWFPHFLLAAGGLVLGSALDVGGS